MFNLKNDTSSKLSKFSASAASYKITNNSTKKILSTTNDNDKSKSSLKKNNDALSAKITEESHQKLSEITLNCENINNSKKLSTTDIKDGLIKLTLNNDNKSSFLKKNNNTAKIIEKSLQQFSKITSNSKNANNLTVNLMLEKENNTDSVNLSLEKDNNAENLPLEKANNADIVNLLLKKNNNSSNSPLKEDNNSKFDDLTLEKDNAHDAQNLLLSDVSPQSQFELCVYLFEIYDKFKFNALSYNKLDECSATIGLLMIKINVTEHLLCFSEKIQMLYDKVTHQMNIIKKEYDNETHNRTLEEQYKYIVEKELIDSVLIKNIATLLKTYSNNLMNNSADKKYDYDLMVFVNLKIQNYIVYHHQLNRLKIRHNMASPNKKILDELNRNLSISRNEMMSKMNNNGMTESELLEEKLNFDEYDKILSDQILSYGTFEMSNRYLSKDENDYKIILFYLMCNRDVFSKLNLGLIFSAFGKTYNETLDYYYNLLHLKHETHVNI